MRLVSFDHNGTAGFGAMVGNDGIVDLGSRLAGVADLRACSRKIAQRRLAISWLAPAEISLLRMSRLNARFPIRRKSSVSASTT